MSEPNDPLGGSRVSPEMNGSLARLRGRGQSLPADIARSMGEAMGADLRRVRIHTGEEPAQLARSVQATAFTHGADIYFGAGSYAPQTPAGQRVLAHELAHTVQPAGGSASGGLVIGRAADPAEAEADRVADRALSVLRRRTRDHVDGQGGDVNGRSVNRTASPATLRSLSPANEPGEPAMARKSAVQRTLENRTTGRVIRRRLPEYATISAQLDPTEQNSNAKVAQKKLKQIIKRTIVAMDKRDAAAAVAPTWVEVAKAEFRTKNPGTNIDLLLDETQPVLADSTPLDLFMQELKSAQGRSNRAPTQVAYPGVTVVGGRPDPAQQIVLDALVQSAARTMRNIAAGQHHREAVQVFGDSVAKAYKTYGDSATALERLKKDNKIVVDNRGDQAAVRASGLTNQEKMALPPNVVASASLENQGTVIHESTHAIEDRTSDDLYTDVKPGSPFLTCPEPERKGIASYYEILARHVLDNVTTPLPVFINTKKRQSGDATGPQAAVETLVTRAWTVAVNSHEELQKLIPQQSSWNNEDQFQEMTRALVNLSKILGLTLHHRLRADKRPPEITELDLAIAEDRAAQLGELLKKAKGINVVDDRDWLDLGWLSFNDTYMEDKILLELIRNEGHTRKNPEREIAMIRVLASTYTPKGSRVVPLMQSDKLAEKVHGR